MERPTSRGHQADADTIQVSCVSNFKQLESRKEEWCELFQQVPSISVFQSFEWNSAWWNAFGEGKDLFLLEARLGAELVGIAPLMRCRMGLPGSKTSRLILLGGKDSDYQDFLIRPDLSEAVINSFVRWLTDNDRLWDHVYLRSVPEWSPLHSWSTPAWTSLKYLTYFKTRYEAPTRILTDAETDKEILKRKSFKRHFNFFNRQGRLEFLNLRKAEEIEPFLESFFRQHQQRWNLTDTPSRFNEHASRAFYHDLVHRLGALDQLLFSVVKFDGNPIAFHFGFEHRGCLIWYKPTYSLEYERHSPGQILLKFLFEYALESGLVEFDFTVGDEPYKYRFANKVRKTYDIHVFKSRSRFLLQRAFDLSKATINRSELSTRLVKKAQRRVRNVLQNPKT